MNYAVHSQLGKKVGEAELVDSVFAAKVSPRVLAQYVHVYLSNQRQAIAHTKDRGEVRGGGRKPWAQKGTGKARAGSSRSPIWRSGGVTFGPLSDRNWKKMMNKKMKQEAIRGAFTKHVAKGTLKLVDQIDLSDKAATKQAADFLTKNEIEGRTIIVLPTYNMVAYKSFANLPKTRTVLVSELNAYDVISAKNVIVLQEALEYIQLHWSK